MASRPPRPGGGIVPEPGVVHAKRSGDARTQQLGVRRMPAKRQTMAQQAHPDVGIFELGARRPGQSVVRQSGVELAESIAGVFVDRVGRGVEVVGPKRQAGPVGRQVGQADGSPIEPRDRDAKRDIG